MTELSPAAQAVRSAYHEICEDYIETWLNFNHNRGLAAALRAAADQVVPDESDIWTRDLRGDAWIRWAERKRIRRDILAIADELDAQ